ncbi:hypothetical protein AB0300_18665 [Microbacterium sp. NPDC078814]|uniref:hypothetical protein n=1 Tax=Microbacterium sp. NPDC078814 TaxID=3154767 RepID=UPI00344C0984
METDISETLAAKVDQITFEDFRPPIERVVTITGTNVKKGADQPVSLELAEFPGRPYRPGKSMRRVLAAIWGTDSAAYIGRKLKLYGDPSIMFGGIAVGGIRIREMSHLDAPRDVVITVKQGMRKPYKVRPLADAPVDPAVVDAAHAAINQATTTQKLDEIAAHATRIGIHGEVADAIETRRAELEANRG